MWILDQTLRQLHNIKVLIAGSIRNIFTGTVATINNMFRTTTQFINNSIRHILLIHQRAGEWIHAAFRNIAKWTWQGFTAIQQGIHGAIMNLPAALRRIHEWTMNSWRWIINKIMKLLRHLFEATQPKLLELGMWQAENQILIEKAVSRLN